VKARTWRKFQLIFTKVDVPSDPPRAAFRKFAGVFRRFSRAK